jgi:putative hemolysin
MLPDLLLFHIPFSIGVTFAILGMLVLLVLTSAISAAESAFFSLSPADIEVLKESTNKTDLRIIELIDRPKRLLATLLISLNFLNMAIVILSTFLMTVLFDFSNSPVLGFVVQVFSVTLLILIIGEIIPKVYSIQNPLPVTRLMAFPVKTLVQLFLPISSFLIFSTSLIDDRIKKKTHSLSVEQLSHALELTSEEELPKDDQKMLQGIVKFGDTDVKQIMHSRMNATAFEYNTPFPELVKKIEASVHSRIPVYKGSFDTIVGVLFIKDILPHFENDDFKWQTLLRSPFFVPESKKIDDLLREFQQNKIHLAIVVDEYGGTSGIVTLEDIIEEVIGDINDEFDDDDLVYSKLDTFNYVFEGKVNLKDVYRILNLDDTLFEAYKGESDSLAGFLIELEGRILTKGEKVQFNNITFTIESADNRKIKRVKITLPENG